MSRMQLMALVGLCFELCVSTSLAQNQAPPQTVVTPPPTAAPPAANPADVASPDAIIAVAYDVIENEIARHTEQWGNILQAFSTYESRHDAKDVMPFARGINSFQLFSDGTRWWILTIYWQEEGPENPLPAEFLPHSR